MRSKPKQTIYNHVIYCRILLIFSFMLKKLRPNWNQKENNLFDRFLPNFVFVERSADPSREKNPQIVWISVSPQVLISQFDHIWSVCKSPWFLYSSIAWQEGGKLFPWNLHFDTLIAVFEELGP